MNEETSAGRVRRWSRHPLAWAAAVLALAVAAAGLWAFQPWRMFTARTVEEALPVAASPEPGQGGAAEGRLQEEAGPAVLAEGGFLSQKHETTGTARVIELADGSRYVRLEDLASSDGPDLYVWLTDQEAGGDWSAYGDGRHIDLGELRGTHGSANYEIPAGADLEGMSSVVIWCERFSVAFGSAPLEL